MSQLYGLFAGLFVCASTWGAMTYLSTDIGWLVGVFLLVFFVTTTIYINGDEVQERQKSLLKSVTDMEIIVHQRLKMIERKIAGIEHVLTVRAPHRASTTDASHTLDSMIHMIDHILTDTQDNPQPTRTAHGVQCDDTKQLIP